MRAACKWEDGKNEKTDVKERLGSMRVPLFSCYDVSNPGVRKTRNANQRKKGLGQRQKWFSRFTANVGRKTWERCMTTCGMTGMWRSSRRTCHTSSIRFFFLEEDTVLKVLNGTKDF